MKLNKNYYFKLACISHSSPFFRPFHSSTPLSFYFKPKIFFDNIKSFVLVDKNPIGHHKPSPSFKGVITVVFSIKALFHEESGLSLYDNSCELNIRKALTDFLDPNTFYVVSFMFKKFKYNFSSYKHTFTSDHGMLSSEKAITKSDLIENLDSFIYFLRRDIKELIKLNNIKYKHPAHNITHLKVVFKPINKNQVISSTHPDLVNNETTSPTHTNCANISINENNMISFSNFTCNDFIIYHSNIISECDCIIKSINNLLSKGLIRKYINPNLLKNIPFLTLNELGLKILSRKASFISTNRFQLNHKRRFHTTSQRYTVNIYSEIKSFLNNNPLNHDTQLKIERFLLNHGLNIFNEKDDKIQGIYTGLYSKKTTTFLIKYKPDIIRKINNFMKFKDEYLSEKYPHKLYLADIISNVGKSFVLTILLGRFIKILSNSKLNYTSERNLLLDIALDLSNDLLREHFKLKYKSKLNENNLHEYTFSD